MNRYKPAGYSIRPISTVDGKPLNYYQTLDYLISILPQAKAEYGPTCTIQASVSENGHTNRDGEYSCSYSTSHEIVAEQPYYSYEDNLAMLKERIEAKFFKAGKKLGDPVFGGKQ